MNCLGEKVETNLMWELYFLKKVTIPCLIDKGVGKPNIKELNPQSPQSRTFFYF